MQTDIMICQQIAGNVEDGKMTDAVLCLITAQSFLLTLFDNDEKKTKPCLLIDLGGENGNIFWLVCRCIHTLIKARQNASACIVLSQYHQQEDYDSTIIFLRKYVAIKTLKA